MKAETNKDVSMNTTKSAKEKLSEAMDLANEALEELGEEARHTTVQKLSEWQETLEGNDSKTLIRQAGWRVDEGVHNHPYVAMGLATGAVAIAATALGISLGNVYGKVSDG